MGKPSPTLGGTSSGNGRTSPKLILDEILPNLLSAKLALGPQWAPCSFIIPIFRCFLICLSYLYTFLKQIIKKADMPPKKKKWAFYKCAKYFWHSAILLLFSLRQFLFYRNQFLQWETKFSNDESIFMPWKLGTIPNTIFRSVATRRSNQQLQFDRAIQYRKRLQKAMNVHKMQGKASVILNCRVWPCMALCDLVWCISYMVLLSIVFWLYIAFSRGHRSKFIYICFFVSDIYIKCLGNTKFKPFTLNVVELNR